MNVRDLVSRLDFRSIPLLIAAWALIALELCGPIEVAAQGSKGKKAEVEKFSGKVTAIEKKGKAVNLKIEKEDGGALDVLVTPRLKVAITGTGDQSLFQPRAWVSSEALVLSNNQLFGRQFTVHYGNAPQAHCRPDPRAADVFLMCGQVLSANEEGLTVQCGRGGDVTKVTFEKGREIEVAVSASNPEFITEGLAVEVEGTTHNGKFIPSQLAATIENPLTADDVQTLLGEKKPARTKSAAPARAKKKSSKTTIEPAEGAPIGPASDPFGVLNEKGAKDEGSRAGEKSPPEKKSDKPSPK